MRLTRLSDAIIAVPVSNVPDGATATRVDLAIKATDATPDAGALIVSAVPSAGVATINITNAQTGALAVGLYSLIVKVKLNDNRMFRLELTDDDGREVNTIEVQPAGIEAVV